MLAPPPNDEQYNDLITLSGGDQISFWRIPKSLKRCPVSSCGKKFEHQELLSAHFVKHHAKKSAYCGECDGPVICGNSGDLASHQQRIHSDQAKIKEEPQEIEVCLKVVSFIQ